MHAPAMSGREARDLLDKMLREVKDLEFDSDIFKAVYGLLDYKDPHERFCRTGELPIPVVAHCQSKLWRDKL